MSVWSEGYTSEIDYIPTYTSGLNLARMRMQLLASDVVPPEVHNACELGFGTGLSVAIHSASSTARWWGTDFNPSDAAQARQLAGQEAASRLFDQSFAEFCQRDDLPEFECIGLHGIWSWISDDNRRIIVDFIRRKLAVGGVLYISYNTLPGWSTKAPLRHLFHQYARRMVAPAGGLPAAMGQAQDFAHRLLGMAEGLRRVNPDLARHLEGLRTKDVNYLVHEYLNGDWQPMYFSQMHDWLSPAKVDFVCADSFTDSHLPYQFSGQPLELLRQIGDPVLRQDVRDYFRNTMFRRDYWVKGARRLDADALEQAVRPQRVQLLDMPDPQKLPVQPTEYVQRLLQKLDSGPRVHTVADLLDGMPGDVAGLYVLLHVLADRGHVRLLQEADQADRVRESCRQFNQRALAAFASRPEGDTLDLASADIGGGANVGYMDALFSVARQHLPEADWQGEQLAAFVQDFLQRHNKSLQRDGQPISDAGEVRQVLQQQAQGHLERVVPLMNELGLQVA